MILRIYFTNALITALIAICNFALTKSKSRAKHNSNYFQTIDCFKKEL
jgi:hypothetical protein